MLKRLVVFMLLLPMTGSFALAQMSLAEKEKKLLSTFVTVFATQYGVGNENAIYVFPQMAKPDMVVLAKAVADEFEESPIATEKRYNNKVLHVTGEFNNVRKNGLSGVFVVLETSSSMHRRAYAKMRPEMADILADYPSGEEIAMVCYEGAVYDILPTFKDCVVTSELKTYAARVGNSITESFLAGKNIDDVMQAAQGNVPASSLLFTIKYAAQYINENSPCYTYDNFNKCQFSKEIPENMIETPEFISLYNKDKEFYHLTGLIGNPPLSQ